MEILIRTFLNIFSVKQFKIKNYLGDWKWAVYQNYNTFNISPGKQAYLCSINDFWDSRLKFLARNNYLPLNERLFKINLRESSKCNICDDDIVEDLHHFLFECKTLRGIRQELFEEIETVIKSFYPDLAFSELPPFQKLQFLMSMIRNSFNIVFLLFYMSFLYFTYN
jgi:hypothetical protein